MRPSIQVEVSYYRRVASYNNGRRGARRTYVNCRKDKRQYRVEELTKEALSPRNLSVLEKLLIRLRKRKSGFVQGLQGRSGFYGRTGHLRHISPVTNNSDFTVRPKSIYLLLTSPSPMQQYYCSRVHKVHREPRRHSYSQR
ncbi:hypothetical protein J6590_053566 [Homalodisca vitripennis]|nr:hypothetical protein J6590_053566 [Homalodisca vitripennis]